MAKQRQRWFRMEGPSWDVFVQIAAALGVNVSTAIRYAIQEYVINHAEVIKKSDKQD